MAKLERVRFTQQDHWILRESMNSKNLLQGGTFSNALSRKVDRLIVQVLAEILSVIDRNCNLDLIDPRNENSPLSLFWCSMFSKLQDLQLQWLDFVGEDDHLPGSGARRRTEDYKCQLPFSWLIFEVIEKLWEHITAGKIMRNAICTRAAKKIIYHKKSYIQKVFIESIQHGYL